MLARHPRLLVRKLSTLFLLGFAAIAALGSDPKQIAEAQALIDRAEQLSSLAQPGSSPFFFQARIDHTPSKVTGKGGIYKLWWAADDKWREEAEADGAKAIRVRNESGLWMSPDFDPKLDAVFGGGRGFPFHGKLLGWDEKITGLKEQKIDGVQLSCVEVEKPERQRELCLDPHSGLLIRIISQVKVHTSSQLRTFDPRDLETEYRDYTGLGDKAVPSEIRHLERGQVTGVLRLISVSSGPKAPFAPNLFDAPAGHELWPACDHYESATLSNDFWRQSPVLLRRGWFNGPGKVADGVRVIVAPEGKAQQVRLVDPTGEPSGSVVSAFMNGSYRPASCNGKPVVGTLFLKFAAD